MFPKEIECGLRAHYYGVDIGQWHRGEMSSRELLILLQGMPEDSWYRQSIERYAEWYKAQQKRQHMSELQRIVRAQLHGQKMEVAG